MEQSVGRFRTKYEKRLNVAEMRTPRWIMYNTIKGHIRNHVLREDAEVYQI